MSEALAYDIVIIGGGPAGIAAACAVAESGKSVLILDSMHAPGGNIWRGTGTPGHPTPPLYKKWTRRLNALRPKPTYLSSATVFAAPAPNRLAAETPDGLLDIRWQKLILATGVRELFLPFPGWTLPNVFGVGGLQSLAKGGWPVEGKRVIIAGTGPLLLAGAAQLRQEGAHIACIAEQAPMSSLFGLAMRLPFLAPSKILQGMGFKWTLRGVPFKTASWISRAHGNGKLESVTLTNGKKSRDIPCDFLACAFSLTPNIEIPRLLGCEITNGVVTTDKWGETSLPNVFCAGEPRGIGGVDSSLLEGEIAGYAAAGQADRARHLLRRARRAHTFRAALARAFNLRPELAKLAQPDTLVCRCEDVTHAQLQPHANFRSAKLHTRTGMGPCQGRICGAACKFMFNWTDTADSPRPPILPVRLESLAQITSSPESLPTPPSPDSSSPAQGK